MRYNIRINDIKIMNKENKNAKHTADNGNDFIADVSKSLPIGNVEILLRALEHIGKWGDEEGKFNYVLLGGIGMIERNVNWLNIVWHPSVSFSIQGEYNLGRIFLSARPELRYRGDLKKVIGSGYIGIGINL